MLGAGLAGGKLAGETALGCLVADLALVPVAARLYGRRGGWAALAVLAPMLVKRLVGNGPPAARRPEVYLCRLLFDRDSPTPAAAVPVAAPKAEAEPAPVPAPSRASDPMAAERTGARF